MRELFSVAGYLSINGEEAFGREVEFLHMTKQEVKSYIMLEALLTCVTIYGSEEWPRGVQQEARNFLDDGYRRLKQSHLLLRRMQDLVAKTDKEVSIIIKKCCI